MSKPPDKTMLEAQTASDEELYARFQTRGDQEALSSLCVRYQDFAYRVAYAKCGNVFMAEETVQEAFLQLARRGSRFKDQGPDSFRAWFYGVIMNLARNLRRVELRTQERAKRAGELEREDASAGEPLKPETASPEVRAALGKALDDLQEDLRMAVVLHHMEGLTQSQVGQLMGVSQPQVARRVSQGLELLRKRLALSGIALSAATIPVCLQESGLLKAPASLQAALKDLCIRASQGAQQAAAHSVRKAAVHAGSGKAVVLTTALVLGAAAVYYAFGQHKEKAPAPEPAASTDSPIVASWNFDLAMGQEFMPRKEFRNDGVHGTHGLPVWQAKGGRNGSGALNFEAPGCSLLLKTEAPSARIPIRLEFDMLIVEAEKLQIGIAQLTNRKIAYPSPASKLNRDPYRVSWKSGQWLHVVREIVAQNGVVITQTRYNGERKGDYQEDPLEPYWTDPGAQIHFEIYGCGFLIDNLKLVYAAPSEAKTSR